VSATTPLPPKPVPDRDTQPFWDAVEERRLVVQRCSSCGHWIWQPKPVCPTCQTPDPVWTEIKGNGRVASWTVLHPPVLPVWADKVPFVVLLVELDEGVRMVGQLVDDLGELLQTNGEAEGLEFGKRVSLRWRVDEAGQTLPAWALSPSDG
jgi:uncharacterized OB-fold protein